MFVTNPTTIQIHWIAAFLLSNTVILQISFHVQACISLIFYHMDMGIHYKHISLLTPSKHIVHLN